MDDGCCRSTGDIKLMTKYDKQVLEIHMIVYKENNTDFSEDELEDIFDSFIQWVEEHKMYAGGGINYVEEETDDG